MSIEQNQPRGAFLQSLANSMLLRTLASALICLIAGCTPPTLKTLAERFPAQRRDLESIVRMSDEDSALAVIDPGWLRTLDGAETFTWYDPAVGISKQRWNEYRRIFRRNHIAQGVRRFRANGDIYIIVASHGLLSRGYSTGYLYCGPGPQHAYPPCSIDKEHGEHPGTKGGEAYSFLKVAERWFVFSDGRT